MAAVTFENQNAATVRSRVDWGAIWAGVFTFIGIWSVFGLLGAVIFASAANPAAARPLSGMGWGMSIWAIVLTIIAMYVGGRVTGGLAAIVNRRAGPVHGLAMFGLSIAVVMAIVVLAGNGIGNGAETAAHNLYFVDVISGLGWAGFFSLFLGWLAALGGASSGSQQKVMPEKNVQPIRNAA